MARDARLGLAQDVGEIGHGEFGLPDQGEDAQARLFARRFQRGVEGVEWQVGRLRSWEEGHRHYKDMFIRPSLGKTSGRARRTGCESDGQRQNRLRRLLST